MKIVVANTVDALATTEPRPGRTWDLWAPCGLGRRRASLFYSLVLLAGALAAAAGAGRPSPVTLHPSLMFTVVVLLLAAVTSSQVRHIVDSRIRSGRRREWLIMDMSTTVAVAAALALPSNWSLPVAVVLPLSQWLRLKDPAVKLVFNLAASALAVTLVASVARSLLSTQLTPLQQAPRYLAAVGASSAIFSVTTTGLVVVMIYLGSNTFIGAEAARALPAEVARTAMSGVGVALFAASPFAILLVAPVVVVAAGELRGRESWALARIDGKTGLANPASLMEEMERTLARAARRATPVSAVMIDLDRFRDVNRQHGHVRADMALVSLADTLRDTARRADLTGRWGGDELVWVMPDTDGPQALQAAHRFRQAVEQLRFPAKEGSYSVTVSLGIAVWDRRMAAKELLVEADAALYAAKEAGRNTVRAAAP